MEIYQYKFAVGIFPLGVLQLDLHQQPSQDDDKDQQQEEQQEQQKLAQKQLVYFFIFKISS